MIIIGRSVIHAYSFIMILIYIFFIVIRSQSVVLIVLQQHGDLLRELARKNDIYTENLDNVSFLVKGHTDMVTDRTATPC